MRLSVCFLIWCCWRAPQNHDGLLTIDEFRESLVRMAPAPVDEAIFKLIVAELDSNRDGLISIKEWLEYCRRHYAMAITMASTDSESPTLLPELPPTHLRYNITPQTLTQ